LIQVGGEASTLAAPVQAQRRQFGLLLLVIDRSVAITVNTVETDAELLVLAKPPAHIQMPAKLGIRHVGAGQPRQRLIASTLGYQVDAAAYRAAGRHAIKQCRRAFEHLDALVHFRRNPVVRRDAIQTTDGHVADVTGEATDGVVLTEGAGQAVAEH